MENNLKNFKLVQFKTLLCFVCMGALSRAYIIKQKVQFCLLTVLIKYEIMTDEVNSSNYLFIMAAVNGWYIEGSK